ncbi:MAG: 3-oxoacyl-[acyl-carrier-protein] reductase [Rhodospirillaceae bacterium]|nr:3-oxoacyl-[acyl-carrier-protein] reductase [Rhodospirillaceae bacterium]
MFDLSGKTALVTGASGGLGSAIARALHAQGAVVGLHGSRREVLEALAADLKERAHIFVANLAESDAVVEKLIPDAEAAMGRLDILVNNAGITRDGLILRMKDQDFWDVININLAVAFKLSRASVKGMMKRRYGRIVNITSVVGVTGNPGQTNYVASKAGLIGLTKSLAQEVASRGITVNAVAPGLIASAISDKLTEDQKARFLEAIPVGRIGEGADIGAAVVYLASAEAAYVTGQTLHVNGGMAMI